MRGRLRSLGRVLGRLLADERGDAGVIEMLLWLPVAAVLLGTMGVALRQNATAGLAQDAAEAAAHQASIGVNPDDGRSLGEASLARSFADQPGTCSGAVDTSGWSAGTVTATVTCAADFGGLSYVGPGPFEVTRTWTETVDAARIVRVGP